MRGTLALCAILIAGVGVTSCRRARQTPSTDSGAPNAVMTARLADSSIYAWWIRDRFTPVDSVIAGLPVTRIDSEWVAASQLRLGLMSPEALADSEYPVKNSDFGVGDDFNRDGVPDSALAGVFRTRAGTLGSFLLILTKAPGGWRVAYLAADTGGARYSSVTLDSLGVCWWFCRECDFRTTIRWTGAHYENVHESEEPPKP